MLDLFEIWGPDHGRVTGIEREVFEAIVARVDELAEEAARVGRVVRDRHVEQLRSAEVESWQSSAQLVYEISRAALALEMELLAVHLFGTHALYVLAGEQLDTERVWQF